ncbi:MAG: coxB, partial [Gammaproteobacteria bacterium]|nr:coxB [Gammaproteobacteria bacterium]
LAGSAVVTGDLDQHIKKVLHGVPGTAMAAFSSQLNDVDIAAVITYTRNAWGNGDKGKYGEYAGESVQPAKVAENRKVAETSNFPLYQ